MSQSNSMFPMAMHPTALPPPPSMPSLSDERSVDLYLELLAEVADPETGRIRIHEGTLHDLVDKFVEAEDLTFEFCTQAYENGASRDEVRDQIRRGAHHRRESGFIRK